MARTPHHVIAVVALGVAALLSACSDGDAEDATTRPRATSPTTAPTSSTSSTGPAMSSTTKKPATPEEQVKADFVEAVRALNRTLGHPTDGVTALAEYFEEPALSRIRSRTDELVNQGRRVKFADSGEPRLIVDSADVADTVADISACFIDDLVEVEANTGAIVSASVRSIRLSVQMHLESSQWKVALMEQQDEWPNTRGCEQ